MVVGSFDSHVIYGIKLASGVGGYRYVGLTTRGADSRLKTHLVNARMGKDDPKYRWMRKHNYDVVVDILEVCPEGDRDYLFYAEHYWVTSLREFGHRLLNCDDGGIGRRRAFKHSEATKARLREFSGVNHHCYGKVVSEETRRKISEANRNRPKVRRKPVSDEARERIRLGQAKRTDIRIRKSGTEAAFYGKSHSEETKLKMSLAQKGIAKSETHRAKLSESLKGKPSKGSHTAWHVNRGYAVESCVFCRELVQAGLVDSYATEEEIIHYKEKAKRSEKDQ